MPRLQIDFNEAAKNQRRLAEKALVQVQDLRESLTALLPGEDVETGRLHDEIEQGIRHLADIESLIRHQLLRNL